MPVTKMLVQVIQMKLKVMMLLSLDRDASQMETIYTVHRGISRIQFLGTSFFEHTNLEGRVIQGKEKTDLPSPGYLP